MRVKCIAILPTHEQAEQIGIGKFYFPGKQEFPVSESKEYIVYSLSLLGCSIWVGIVGDYDQLISVPLCLFEIIDGRVSKYWKIGVNEAGYLSFWPPSFYQPFYHDDLSEKIPEIENDFKKVRLMIEKEAIS